ncbi:MAG: phage baseplate protein [Anaerolineae bacterium]|nr:phage baseplate protein [Anaerolineae bacterium]
MRPLSTWQLLSLWEQGLAQPLANWALLVLSAACPETPAEQLAELSIGNRDSHILTLREWTFGPNLTCLAACPTCSEKLELNFQTANIRALPPPETSELMLTHNGYQVRFRLPNSVDVTAVTGDRDPTENRRLLFQRCLLEVRRSKGKVVAADVLPEPVVEAVITQMAAADPQADVQLALDCPHCRHHWLAPFDIVAFFWAEINTWAYRVLHEVHLLAAAYGWSEADILALTPWRRRFYLEMVRP